MKATPPGRALAFLVDVLDRFWGPIAVAIILVLEVTVFGPRGMVEWMIGAGLLGWIARYAG